MKRQNRGWLSRYGIWNTPQKVVDFVKEHGQLHETWFDLFFDLIFVAFALKMGALLLAHFLGAGVVHASLMICVCR